MSSSNTVKIDKPKSGRSIKLGTTDGRLKVEIGDELDDKTKSNLKLDKQKQEGLTQGKKMVDSAAKWAKENTPALIAIGCVGLLVTRKQGLGKTLSWVATTVSTAAISKLFN